jgi:peptidase E
MKTKFILHGGATSVKSVHNNAFFAEFTSGLKDGDTVLYVGFARESIAEQREVYERDREKICSSTKADIDVVFAEESRFQEQLKNAQAIYVTGGKTSVVKQRLQQFPDFAELLAGKVYAGSSAGANVVSKCHTSGFADGLQKGLGIVPVCVMAHYGNPEYNAGEEQAVLFRDFAGKYDLLKLAETEWEVREVDVGYISDF